MNRIEVSCSRCGHDRDKHTHLRPGRDCSVCDCPRWIPPGPLGFLLRLLPGRHG